MGLQDIQKVAGIAGDVGGPLAEAAVGIHGANPLSEKFALGSILLRILAFDF